MRLSASVPIKKKKFSVQSLLNSVGFKTKEPKNQREVVIDDDDQIIDSDEEESFKKQLTPTLSLDRVDSGADMEDPPKESLDEEVPVKAQVNSPEEAQVISPEEAQVISPVVTPDTPQVTQEQNVEESTKVDGLTPEGIVQ